jgi:hypothetical protein
VPNGVHVIGTGSLEKLLKVVSGLPHLELKIMLSNSDELLVRVTDILFVVTLIVTGSESDSLGPLLRTLLSLLVPLFTPLSVVLGGTSRLPPGATFPLL